MSLEVPDEAVDVEVAPPATTCFLCALDTRKCDVAQVEGMLLGARVDTVEGRSRPFVGLRTDSGERIRVNLGAGSAQFVQRLSGLAPAQLRGLRIRALHLRPGIANPPKPGEAPFRVLHALAAGMLVLEPDLLINITDLSNGNYCVRQDVLQRLLPSRQSVAALRGTIIHDIFKEILKDSDADIGQLMEDRLRNSVVQMAEVEADAGELRAEIQPHLERLAQWRADQSVQLWHSAPQIRAETFLLAPEIGLKGRLDILWTDGDEQRLLELKTGGSNGDLPKMDHRWQVYGYQALLAARRDGQLQGAPRATLIYSGAPVGAAVYGIPGALREIQRVVELRNELAIIRITGTVPPPPGGARCERCSKHAGCAQMSQLLDWSPPPGNNSKTVPRDDAAWLHKWYTLQLAEARTGELQSRALWRDSTAQRIAAGSAIGNLRLIEEPTETERHEWIFRFHADNSSELREGDEVLISNGDPVHGEVVSGSILNITSDTLTVWGREYLAAPTLIDRYSADVVAQRMLHNLTRWLDIDDHLRALVRGDARPRFNLEPPPIDPGLLAGLNAEQADAVVRALTMRDYLLIQGPPGTGKTNVIASIARALLKQGYRVALAAYTNQATDTMLKRLIDLGITNLVRLGHEFAVAPELQPYRLLPRAQQAHANGTPDAAAVRELLRTVPMVAATVATWSSDAHEIEDTMPRFDVMIVDEASQLTIPAAVGALRWAKRFILVGDEQQLPPLVVDEVARDAGLGTSLFSELLALAPQDATIALRRQYRMHAALCAFPSAQFYRGMLVADDAVAQATLQLGPTEHMEILDPQRPLVWVDVPPTGKGNTKYNDAEAQIAIALGRSLIAGGVAPDQIGMIAPFRAQVARLRQVGGDLVERGVTIDTVDRFQGGERQVILLSLVLTDPPAPNAPLATFLGDPRRLNVALTRARHKLIIIGHRPAFATLPLLADLARYCANG